MFVGDTLWAESEITDVSQRVQRPTPPVGIVGLRTRGLNQRREVVIEFRRSFMAYRRGAAEVTETFPHSTTDWTV